MARALAVWLSILVLAIVNGALREAVLIPLLGPATGLLLSGVSLSAMILMATYLALPWMRAGKPAQLVAVGIGWLLLTVAFESCFGVLQGKSLRVLLAAYTFQGGNIWPIVLVVTAAAPYIAGRLRSWLR